ncbi:MAG TPA: ABC transporter permease, partial [Thermoanaerobaculia bacterium]|nr:ABC transporter permease [Thermoanaerobaculia bacterium]
VWQSRQADGSTDVTSFANYQDWKRESAFTGLAAFAPMGVNVTGDGGEPERVPAAVVSANFFSVLGVKPELGRSFSVRDERLGEDGVVLLSRGLWQRRFGSDPKALGRSVRVRGRPLSIIGVLPASFDFPQGAQLWMPLAPNPDRREERGIFWLRTVGRLRPGVDLARAKVKMEVMGERLRRQYPDVLQDYGVSVRPIRDYLVGDIRPALLILFGAVTLVLFIACANVANLLLARTASREQEIIVRTAVGASRGRVIRQLLTEGVTLGILGGLAGLFLALWGVGLLRSVIPANLHDARELSIHSRTFFFTLVIAVSSGLLGSLAPALQMSRLQLGEALKERGPSGGGRPRRLILQGLVIAEVALALVLLVSAGLLLQSFARLRSVAPVQAERALTVNIPLNRSDYPEPERIDGFFQQLLQRVRALPEVQSVGATSAVFLPDVTNSEQISVEGRSDPSLDLRLSVTTDAVTPDLFRALGLPILHGRSFAEQDGTGEARVAIINQAMARRFWPREDVVGKRFKLGAADSDVPWITVIGMVGDAWRSSPERGAPPSCYLPLVHLPRTNMTLVVRTTGDPRPLAPAIVREIHALDPNQPVARVATVGELMGEHLSVRRLNALLVGAFALLALGLAAVGVYSVISCMVSQGIHEIGIRMALGAQSGDVLRMVLANGLSLALLGIVFGLGGALVAGQVLASAVYGVRAIDSLSFCGLSLFLVLVAASASYFPARRASQTDPMTVLRG